MCSINLKITPEDRPEFVGQIIDIFEDFLEDREGLPTSPEKEKPESDSDCEIPVRIYGDDYDALATDIEDTLKDWSVCQKEVYETHYKTLLRSYFADTTIQGQIQKRGAFKEAEWVLENLFDVSPNEIKTIYDAEYQNSVQM